MKRGSPSIPTRIFLGFAVLCLLLVGLGVASLVEHDRTALSLRRLHEGYLPLALTVGESKANQAVFVTLLDDLLDEPSGSLERDWLGIARRVRPATIRRALHGADRIVELAETREEHEAALRMIETLHYVDGRFTLSNQAIDRVLEAMRRGDPITAARELSTARVLEVDAQRKLRELHLVLEARSADIARSASEREARMAVVLSIATLLGLLLGLGVTYLSYRLLSPLPRLQARVGAVAGGEFSNPLEATSDDELGRLTEEFERMVQAIATRDKNLREAAERMERLQRMQEQIVAGLRAAVLVIDGELHLRAANPVAMKLFGLGEESIGKTLDELGLASIPELSSVLDEARRGETTSRAAVSLDEGRRVDLRASPFGQLESARGGSVLLVIDDVTEELATKARLLSTERLAAIGRLAAHVTHEVRNPLSSIALNVEMLGDELPSDSGEARVLLRAIHREIDRLTALTEEYLRLARVPDPRRDASDLVELVDDLVRFVRPEFERAGITLASRVVGDVPEIPFDDAQLRQALLNLLRNAREAMPEGGHAAVDLVGETDAVEIRVADEGVGMSDELRAKVFDAFVSTKAQGTGLGLPLTQQIVAAHGGTIRCQANGARGTVFVIRLPRHVVSDKPAA